MTIEFKCDPEKARANRAKHRVSLEDPAAAFAELLARWSSLMLTTHHSDEENR